MTLRGLRSYSAKWIELWGSCPEHSSSSVLQGLEDSGAFGMAHAVSVDGVNIAGKRALPSPGIPNIQATSSLPMRPKFSRTCCSPMYLTEMSLPWLFRIVTPNMRSARKIHADMMTQRAISKIREHGFRFVTPLVDYQVVPCNASEFPRTVF